MKVLEAKWSAEEGGGSVTFEQVACPRGAGLV